MRVHRFIINKDLKKEQLVLDDKELFNQVRNVLRLDIGSKVAVADGRGGEGLAQITSLRKGSVELQIQEVFKNDKEQARHIILYCSVLKKENFELVVQKATEVGVKEIFPIITERTIKFNIKMDRLQKIVKEAAEQSGRAIVPKLYEPIRFADAVSHAKQNETNWFFDSSGLPVKKETASPKNRLGIFIGPEGGWTEEELKSAKDSKFKTVSLGKLTLRAETAAIVASYIAANL